MRLDFGWSISNDDLGESLAKGIGPSGISPTSYCAEACGMLTMLRFQRRLAEFVGYHEQWTGTIATESNLSLIETIKDVAPDQIPDSIGYHVSRVGRGGSNTTSRSFISCRNSAISNMSKATKTFISNNDT